MDFTQHFILVTPSVPTPEFSLFMGFTRQSIFLNAAIDIIIRLYPNLAARHLEREELVRYKLLSRFNHFISPLMEREIIKMRFGADSPFRIFVTPEELDDSVALTLSKLEFPSLHIKSADLVRVGENRDVGIELLDNYARIVGMHIEAAEPKAASAIDELLSRPIPREKPRRIQIQKMNHGVTRPNEQPLILSGADFLGPGTFSTLSEEPYLNAIRKSAYALNNERERLHKKFPPELQRQTIDLIITCPGVLHYLSSAGRIKKLFSGTGYLEIQQAVKHHASQGGYSVIVGHKDLEFLASAAFREVTKMWQDEISTYTTAIMLQTWQEFCPSLRLPRRIYQARGLLSRLGTVIRNSCHDLTSKKVNRIANQFYADLKKEMDLLTPGFLDGYDRQIRLIADLPLGLVPEKGLPISLRHFVSQIPSTPGDLLTGSSCRTNRHFFKLSKTQRVTIIRSFEEGDPLKHVLEECIKLYSDLPGWDWEVKIVDVKNEEEFIYACNNLKDAFLVFDGHGSHSEDSQVGTICLGSEKVDIWSLRGKIHLPPMVLLSCCDSCPADRSHVSIANGFLALGAESVFGALMPIDGVLAGTMVTRLLYRLTSVTRFWCNLNNLPLSWSKVVTSQMRASYISEFLLQLLAEKKITQSQYDEISIPTTERISFYSSDWFGFFKAGVKMACGWSDSDFASYVEDHFSFPHALHYLSLGFPDKILFAADEFEEK
ncbi:hypothetical protein N9A70_00145 [Akkermansiaceae bacterium]|jgi:hypothetical protein|nr:hypothetical protein [Akkermansiaceae bacterium]MDA7907278.1 hypothetical protein [Akkermansiaceae bacterium]